MHSLLWPSRTLTHSLSLAPTISGPPSLSPHLPPPLQCQAIHARSFVPCQDTPGAKMTYTAAVRVPADLTALMSAVPLEEPGGCSRGCGSGGAGVVGPLEESGGWEESLEQPGGCVAEGGTGAFEEPG